MIMLWQSLCCLKMIKMGDKIKEIFARVFNIKLSEISDSMSKENTPEWDSLNNLMLLTEVEKEYNIKFTASEITKIKCLKDIESILESRGA